MNQKFYGTGQHLGGNFAHLPPFLMVANKIQPPTEYFISTLPNFQTTLIER